MALSYNGIQVTSNTANLTNKEIANIGQGLNLSEPFSKTSGKTNDNIGFDRINQSIQIIFETSFKEVPMLPILGSNLDKLLFEPITEVLDESLKVFIQNALEGLETRVQIIGTSVTRLPDENKVIVSMEYVLTGTNISNVFNYEIATGTAGDVL